MKVVDFETDATPAVIGTRLIDETLQDPAAVEVGWQNNMRYGIATCDQPLPAQAEFSLEKGSVFLVSGGSGGIIRPIVEDLVKTTQGTFYLLNRSALPDPNSSDLTRLTGDRDGLKKDLAARLTAAGKKATPLQVENAVTALERSAACLETMKIIGQMGGKAYALECDITDPAAVQKAMRQVKESAGHIDVFLHAAGIELSRKLKKKTVEEFRQVVSVKADGFFNIYKSMINHDLLPRAMVFFSSVAGRFGNAGQTDYSAANDLLCKMASAMSRQHPAIKVISIDWSAWGGVGMATRGNIPALMKMAGIDLLDPRQAAAYLHNEILAGSGESIAAGSLGALLEPKFAHGGLDVAQADDALRAGKPIHTMLSHITDFDINRGLVLEADLDPAEQPFLHDHAMNGTPILPGVMGIEGFSIAAKHIGSVLISGKGGGFEVSKLEDIRFLTAFKFYGNKPRRVTWIARAVRERAGLVVYVTLESTRMRRTRAEETVLHFTGKVHLEPQGSQAREMRVEPPNWNGHYTVKAEDIYALYFHGPAFQVLEGVQRSGRTYLGKLHKSLPGITQQEHAMLSTPTLVELCFQTAGVWEIGKTGTLALPRSVESLVLYRQNINGVAIYAEVTPVQSGTGDLHFDCRVVDAKGRVYLELKDYRTTPLSDAVENKLVAPMEELVRDS